MDNLVDYEERQREKNNILLIFNTFTFLKKFFTLPDYVSWDDRELMLKIYFILSLYLSLEKGSYNAWKR